MENAKRVIDEYLFDLKFTVSKIKVKVLFLVVLISTILCITEIFSMSGLSDEASYFLSPLPEAVVQRCFVKTVFLEISQNSQENTYARVSFSIKLQASGLQLY